MIFYNFFLINEQTSKQFETDRLIGKFFEIQVILTIKY